MPKCLDLDQQRKEGRGRSPGGPVSPPIELASGIMQHTGPQKGPTLFKAEEDNLLSPDGPDVTTLAIRGLTARGLLQPLTDDVMTWAEASCSLSLML